MPSIEWLTPAPLWAPKAADLRIPRLVKLESDNFLPDFLEAMALAAPGQTPKDFLTDSNHDFQAPEDRIDGKLKLFHPAHGRFYLVTGSLVCRQLGLPDRPVALQDGERTSFVVRRRVTIGGKLQEQAWVDQGLKRGWQPLVDERGRAVTARSDEERHPLHPVQTSMVATTNGSVTMNGNGKLTIPAARTLHYGYIPVGNREKYLDRRPLAAPTPEEILHQYEQDVRSASAVDGSYDFRLDELKTRVLDPWRGIYTAATDVDQLKGQSQEKLPEFSLYLILDLADWLQRYLPSVFAAAAENQALPAGSKRQALLEILQDIIINRPPFEGNPNNISLAAAIKRLKNKIELVRGIGTEPNDTYNVRDATRPDGSSMSAGNGVYLETSPGTGEFLDAIQAALNESTAPVTPPQESAGAAVRPGCHRSLHFHDRAGRQHLLRALSV